MISLLDLVLTKIFIRSIIKTWLQSFEEFELALEHQSDQYLDYMICLFYSESNTDRTSVAFWITNKSTTNFYLLNILKRTDQFPVKLYWFTTKYISLISLYYVKFALSNFTMHLQKQPSRRVLSKRCSENMQQIYRRTSMPKYDLKSYFSMGVLLWICWMFSELLLLRTPLGGCLCICHQ